MHDHRKLLSVAGLVLVLVLVLLLLPHSTDAAVHKASNHSSNWAVLVCTSKFWFNYRHFANTLSMYHTIKRLGIPDSQIILMLADDMPCSAHNAFPAQVFNNKEHTIDLYGDNVEVDYRGNDVNVENFLRVLTGRHTAGMPRSKQLNTDEGSNILIYMSGHGGDGFLKFQDFEEVTSVDLAEALDEMHSKRRYNEVLLMVDTCQASTLGEDLAAPNVAYMSSSVRDENSYAHHTDYEVGVAVIDRWTFYTLDFFEQSRRVARGRRSRATLEQLARALSGASLGSTANVRSDLLKRRLRDVPVSDFFGAVPQVDVDAVAVPLLPPSASSFDDTSITSPSPSLPPSTMAESSASLPSVPKLAPSSSVWVTLALGFGATAALAAFVGAAVETRLLSRATRSAQRRRVKFHRMDGAGNQFVVFDCRTAAVVDDLLTPPVAQAIARTSTGIGCDQLVLLAHPNKSGAGGNSVLMRIMNADGSEVGACGNATRCVALFEHLRTGRRETSFNVDTVEPRRLQCRMMEAPPAGSDTVTAAAAGSVSIDGAKDVYAKERAEEVALQCGWVEVNMGAPILDWEAIPLAGPPQDTTTVHLQVAEVEGGAVEACCVNMGNPHAVLFVKDVSSIDVGGIGKAIESHTLFPAKVNVSFVQVLPQEQGNELAVRAVVWERGAGRTAACGTAACAIVVALCRVGVLHRDDAAHVRMDGGTLRGTWRTDGHVLLAGPARLQCSGSVLLPECVWEVDR